MSQIACETIGPAMKTADKAIAMAPTVSDDLVCAMGAYIVKTSNCAILASYYEERAVGHRDILDKVVAGFRNLIVTSNFQPDATENLVALALEVVLRQTRFDRNRVCAQFRILGRP